MASEKKDTGFAGAYQAWLKRISSGEREVFKKDKVKGVHAFKSYISNLSEPELLQLIK